MASAYTMFTRSRLDYKMEMYTMYTAMDKKDVILAVRVEDHLEKLIKSMAEKEDRSTSWMLRHLILEGLKAKKIKRPKA
jgi:hypothetical protein